MSGKALRLPDTVLTRYGVPEAKACKAICWQIFCGQVDNLHSNAPHRRPYNF